MAQIASQPSTAYKQLLQAKIEVENSVSCAQTLRTQWLVANTSNSNDLTKREVDHLGKLFRNKLLTARWDCEDLEELLNSSKHELKDEDQDLLSIRQFIGECRNEIASMIRQLDDTETKTKTFSKHGIDLASSQHINPLTSIAVQNNYGSKYEKLTNDPEEVQFDKDQVQSATSSRLNATVYNNALYDHLETNQSYKTYQTPQVFSNVGRPEANVYMNTNEHEIILDMLETEFYNPPDELRNTSQLMYALRKLLDTDRNKMLGAIAFIFSFPILLVLFLVA